MTIKNNIILNLEDYVNPTTGETMLSEIVGRGITLQAKENTDLISLPKKENFAVVDTDILLLISKKLSNNELGHLFKMIGLTKTDLNILYNHSVPHTNKSLQKYLEIKSNKTFFELVKVLMKDGILYQMKGSINGAVRVIYLLNPYLSSRRKTFNKSLLTIFKDLRE